VAVFVDLYCKRQQLQEQAALLRGRLAGRPDDGPSRADIAAELSDRLAAVESSFAKLRPVVADPAADDVAAGLRRLRAVVEALDAR
jgi:hypothetical protein